MIELIYQFKHIISLVGLGLVFGVLGIIFFICIVYERFKSKEKEIAALKQRITELEKKL